MCGIGNPGLSITAAGGVDDCEHCGRLVHWGVNTRCPYCKEEP